MAWWKLTRATPKDLVPLVALEGRCFDLPWGRLSFEGELAAAEADSRIAWAAVAGEKRIVGYIFFRFIADEVHVFRIAVDPAWRRRGIGARLMAECLDAAHVHGMTAAVLEARPSNTEAIALYRKLGFRLLAMRPGYYSDRHEDALVLRRTLT